MKLTNLENLCIVLMTKFVLKFITKLKKLIEKFKEFGADDNAKDIARVLRIENTIN